MELPVGRGRPNDARGFLHKSTLGRFVGGLVKRAVPVVGIASTVVGTARSLVGGRSRGRGFVPRTELGRGITRTSEFEKGRGVDAKFGGPAPEIPFIDKIPCKDPALVRASDGHCVARGSGHFESHFGREEGSAVPVGDAVMGRYGAALTPGSMIIDRAVCLKGMQLADDGLCYNKSQISNKQRMWPAGRKPLLSGGDMRAISIAARAGRRLEGATKRLQRLGMMKKPQPRRLAPHQHARLLPAVSIKQ